MKGAEIILLLSAKRISIDTSLDGRGKAAVGYKLCEKIRESASAEANAVAPVVLVLSESNGCSLLTTAWSYHKIPRRSRTHQNLRVRPSRSSNFSRSSTTEAVADNGHCCVVDLRAGGANASNPTAPSEIHVLHQLRPLGPRPW